MEYVDAVETGDDKLMKTKAEEVKRSLKKLL